MTQPAFESLDVAPSTLLIVEDDVDIQMLLRDLLTPAGYEVVVTDSGSAALDVLDCTSVDLVILDVMLPDMSGYAIAEQVRQNTLGYVPIVMLTALTQPHNVTQGLVAGADDYISKPFHPEELLLRVRNQVQRHALQRTSEREAAALRETLGLVQRHLEVAQTATQVEMTLRREFLHNVTTHMHALHGIAEATLRKLPPSPERDAVRQLKSRIGGAALVYQVSEALQTDPVGIGQVIRMIATALKNMYRPWKRITLTVTGADVDLPLAVAAPVAMMINELVTNCFKHAFPDNHYGTIDVTYAYEGRMFALTVNDNGVGFTANQQGNSMGRTAIEQMIQGLNGTVVWQSSTAGTQVHIHIPVDDTLVALQPAAAPM